MLTAQDKEDIAGMVDTPVQDVQVNGTSVLDAQGVANVPLASITQAGVQKVNGAYGVSSSVGGTTLSINRASNTNIVAGTEPYKPIVPANQHKSTFYGLAKAAGDTTQSQSSNEVGSYTETAKSAIHEMLNGPASVSGSTPTITAMPGIQYVCGEVATLDITLPASGCIDVVFESGSTPTVLTITPPSGVTEVEWADGFDPDNLSANATYWLKVIDGKLGVATAWGVQSGGGGEKPWNHVQFSVTDESEQTKYFEIINTSVVSEILVTGKVVFDSYDKFVVYIGNVCVTYEDVIPSETNCYVGIHISRSVDIWLGNCNASQWNSISSMFDKVQRPNARSNGVGNIRFGSRWLNKTYLTGTSLDVYWR